MKIIINFSPPGSTSKVYKTELTSSNSKETWGELTQRYIEHSSLHPPQLLSLLKSLNHGSANKKYQLRYGDGYATSCNITWNASSRGSAGGEDDEMIEANITLKPLAGSPLANTSLGKVSDISMLVIADSVPTKVKSAALEISVELVGLPNPNSDIKMTQAPFPIDMEKVNVLDIVEHGRFEGVVDQYSLKKFNESGQVGAVAATPMSSGKKRKESSTSSSAAANTTTKKASAAATAATSSTKKKEKNKDKATATTSSKKQKTVKDNTNDGKDVSAETTPKKSSSAAAAEETTEKKKSKKKKKKRSSDVEEEDKKAGPTGTVKKSRKSSDGKGEEDEANPVAESSPPKSSKKEKKKKKKSKESDEDKDEEEETSPSKAKLPKRPVNAYMLYGNAVRQQVKDANPELKPTEVMKMIAEMYRGLSPEELQKYKDMATANMTKFKEEYGEDALKQSTKKKKKKKKEEKKEDDEEDVVATEVVGSSTKKDEVEESDDESESEDDGEAIPKPPASAYIDYSSFIRPKIKEENPDATPTEIMTLIGAAYKELDEDTLQKFKDKATKNMADYKAKYGEDAVAKSRRQVKKDKEKKKKDKEKKKRKSSAAIGAGDKEGDAGSPKKKKQKSSDTGAAAAAASPKKSVIYDQPAVPAEGLPAGWTTRSITRKTGNHVDKYFFSPTEEYKFVSKPKVVQFLECMVSAENNEVAAMKLYKEKEKKKKGTAASPKKSKSVEAETVVVTKKHTDSDSDDSSSDGSVPEEADAEAKVVKEADNSDSDSQSSEGSAPAAWAA